jgi:hypothetical protein
MRGGLTKLRGGKWPDLPGMNRASPKMGSNKDSDNGAQKGSIQVFCGLFNAEHH